MGIETVSTHTVKNDATTTIVTRTTTIVSEHEEILAEPKTPSGVVENVKRSFRDYWFPSHSTQEDEDDEDDTDASDIRHDPSLLKNNSVVRRAYDYWKSLTQDADESAKQKVMEAKKARDEAAEQAKWAIFGFKKEAREAYEAAEKKYKEALEAAERVHHEAHEKAKSKWFQDVDTTEIGELKDKASDMTHKKWDRFKSAVNSFAFNPPKYGCSPSTQYWFHTGPSTGWDCREIWDHPNRHDHRHLSIKTLPKKHLPIDKVHDTLTDLWHQAANKAKNAPSVSSSFESSLKPVKDQYHHVLDRIYRNEQGALDELDALTDKMKAKLNEAKYYEEQTDSWLTSQWNAVIDNAGETKDQYERALKRSLKSIKNTRDQIYNSLLTSLQKSVQNARNNIHDAYRTTKDHADKSKLHKAIKDATDSFTSTIKEAETKMKTVPKNAYEDAIEAFNRDTAQLKAKLEHAASVASKSASSASRHASKSASSLSAHASKSASSFGHHASKSVSSAAYQASQDAKSLAGEAQKSFQAATDKARSGFDQATASANSMWQQATPIPSSTMHKVHDQYHHLLGNVHSQWFHDQDRGEMNASSVYGALLAIYFLYLAHRIWSNRRLARMPDPKEATITVVKNGDKPGIQNGGHATLIETYKAKPSTEDALEKDRKSYGNILTQFTSVVPVTLILLILLELAGFSRVALHSLFVGLVTSQLLQGGVLGEFLTKMGILDGVHASSRDIGLYVSWAVLGLAAMANAIKALHE
ncbi:hypothetical protein BGX34_008228 [Mortierella sp. NVP85]|nr:hypothetical protein BGX34_008228 [Mortierella sp. NVP85]